MIAGRINVELIRAHWSEILRVVASIRTGTVTASLIMGQLASHPRQNGVAAALCELGRMERTLFTLDWIDDPQLRRPTGQELNKDEARNSLARAVFLHRLGEIRDRTYGNQQHRASGLNLIVATIILWNTRYLERAVATHRQGADVPDHLLAHLPQTSMPLLLSKRSTCLIACLVTKPRACAMAWPIIATASKSTRFAWRARPYGRSMTRADVLQPSAIAQFCRFHPHDPHSSTNPPIW